MNNQEKIYIAVILLVVVFLTFGFVMANPGKGSGGTVKECRDGLDNDGDGAIDLKDMGCVDRGDNDETNCGDNICEGGETSSSCPADCSVIVGNSCEDSDGGFVIKVQGTVSGVEDGLPFNNTDYCIDNSNVLKEFYCGAQKPFSLDINCQNSTFGTTACSVGACV